MLLKIHPETPEQRKIAQVADCLKRGGVIIYPTDTVYALGCDVFNTGAVERIQQIKGGRKKGMDFSFVCYDLSHITDFTLPVDTPVYKLMRRTLPGAFTYILRANNHIPKLFKTNKRTIGIRVPDNDIARMIVKELGNPLLSTSIHKEEDEVVSYFTGPEEIYGEYMKLVDIVIDGGIGGDEPSTVIDCTGTEPVITREGKGKLEEY